MSTSERDEHLRKTAEAATFIKHLLALVLVVAACGGGYWFVSDGMKQQDHDLACIEAAPSGQLPPGC